MKTKEELNALKEEVETLKKKLAELTEEELAQVSGGATGVVVFFNSEKGLVLSQILCKHRFRCKIEQNIFKAGAAEAASALSTK